MRDLIIHVNASPKPQGIKDYILSFILSKF